MLTASMLTRSPATVLVIKRIRQFLIVPFSTNIRANLALVFRGVGDPSHVPSVMSTWPVR